MMASSKLGKPETGKQTAESNKKVDSETPLPNEVVYIEQAKANRTGYKEVIVIDDEDDDGFNFVGETGFIKENKSVFLKAECLKLQEAIPIIPKRVAIACLVLNFMFPGLGTALGAFASIFCQREQQMTMRWVKVFIWNIAAAILQLATTVYLFIGYFWGIWWGIQMIQKAPSHIEERPCDDIQVKKMKQGYEENATSAKTATYVA